MAYTSSSDLSNVEALILRLRELANTTIEYGYFGKQYPANDPYGRGGMNVAGMAITHEYGDPTGKIPLPARPFMAASYYSYFLNSFNRAFQACYASVFLGQPVETSISFITAQMKVSVEFAISNSNFATLSQWTKDRRAALGIQGDTPLDATGVLKNSVEIRVNGVVMQSIGGP